jgi:hypothetical protein
MDDLINKQITNLNAILETQYTLTELTNEVKCREICTNLMLELRKAIKEEIHNWKRYIADSIANDIVNHKTFSFDSILMDLYVQELTNYWAIMEKISQAQIALVILKNILNLIRQI